MKKEENIAKQAEQKAMGYLESKYPGENITKDASIFGGVKICEKFRKEYGKKYEEIYKDLELKKIKGDHLKKEKKPSEKEIIAELTETLQRTQAEFENYKKRVDKDKTEFVKYAKAEIIQKILPTLDTFEIAFKSTSDKEKFVKGIEMVYAQLFSLLESEGLKPIESVGKKFDHYLHEVMLKEKSDKDEDIILEELQKGYMLNDKVLRHSKVKVSEKDNKNNSIIKKSIK